MAARLIGEDYVGCSEAQVTGDTEGETVPSDAIAMDEIGGSGHAVDVRYYYDIDPSWASSLGTKPTALDENRLVAVADRAQRTLFAYDTRGGLIWQARQAALISLENSYSETTLMGANPAVVTGEDITPGTIAYDETHTYTQTFTYDHLQRSDRAIYPLDPDYFYDPDMDMVSEPPPVIEADANYNKRGLFSRSRVRVDGGTWIDIIRTVRYERDRHPESLHLRRFPNHRHAPEHPVRRSASGHVHGGRAERDAGRGVGRPRLRDCGRLSELLLGCRRQPRPGPGQSGERREPPRGIRSADVNISHDALYRVTQATYTYHDGTAWGSDVAHDWRDERLIHQSADPMREQPAPMLPAMPANRVEQLDWSHDWLANMTSWTDDADSFYERSIGGIVNGHEEGRRPTALYMAASLNGGPSSRGGWLEMSYGASGNVETMTVHGQCRDASGPSNCVIDSMADLDTNLATLRSECVCDAEQHYQYRWDEVNRLSEARRYDSDGSGTWDLAVRHRYRYDSGNQRIIKHVLSVRHDESHARVGASRTLRLSRRLRA